MKVAIFLGTRPELIKMSPIIHAIKKSGNDCFIIHTGQHNIKSLIKDLKLPKPDISIDLPPKSAGKFKGSLFTGIFNAMKWSISTALKIRRIIKEYKPDFVLYQGDTLAIASTALAAKSIFNCPVTGHIEAGLRTRDFFNPFPEEFARWFADKLSDLMFVSTVYAANNLKQEMFIRGKIFLTGNTVVDSSLQNMPLAEKLDIKLPKKYCIVFIHRQENIHSKNNLSKLLELLKNIEEDIIFIKHPSIMEKLKDFNLLKQYSHLSNIQFKDFYDYLPFLKVLKHSKYVITDSGGLQEEACTLKFPCLVWREKTERPESIKAGVAVLTKCNVKTTLGFINDIKKRGEFYNRVMHANNPFGDGKAAEKIVNILMGYKK